MSNDFRYTRRDDGTYTVHAQGRGSGYANLGKVHRSQMGNWGAEYDHGDGWQTAGMWTTRHAAAQQLLARHEARWGPIDGDGRKTELGADGIIPIVKADPRPPQSRYAVLEGDELRAMVQRLSTASADGRAVRFTVHGGLKYDAGDGWTPSLGRQADETGH